MESGDLGSVVKHELVPFSYHCLRLSTARAHMGGLVEASPCLCLLQGCLRRHVLDMGFFVPRFWSWRSVAIRDFEERLQGVPGLGLHVGGLSHNSQS